MKAAEARSLKVGDWVRASFAGYVKSCEITAIEWPTFHLRTTDSRGEVMERTRRYTSIFDKAEKRENGTRVEWPFWLERPLQGDLAK